MLSFFTQEQIRDPYSSYAKWRSKYPIWREPTTGFWVLSRHKDIQLILKDPERFSSAAMGGNSDPSLPLLGDDPPKHTLLRNLIGKAFNRNVIENLEEEVTKIADELVNQIVAGIEFDIVSVLTSPLPTIVISRLLGIPEEKKEDFKLWSDSLTGVVDEQDLFERAKNVYAMKEYFAGLVVERRAKPSGDLVSLLANAELDGHRLSDTDIINFSILLLVAGNETTTNLISNLLNIVVDQPDIWDRMHKDAALVETVVEETLRYDSPVQYILRKTTRDVHFYGERVAAGESMIIVIGSANRDPELFTNPDHFDIERGTTPHFAFGHGIHFCIGALLARLEARKAVLAIIKRASVIERGVSASLRVPSHMLRGFQRLPVIIR